MKFVSAWLIWRLLSVRLCEMTWRKGIEVILNARNYRVENNKYSGEVINNSVWHDRQSNHVNQMDEWRAFSDEKSKWKKTYLIK